MNNIKPAVHIHSIFRIRVLVHRRRGSLQEVLHVPHGDPLGFPLVLVRLVRGYVVIVVVLGIVHNNLRLDTEKFGGVLVLAICQLEIVSEILQLLAVLHRLQGSGVDLDGVQLHGVIVVSHGEAEFELKLLDSSHFPSDSLLFCFLAPLRS